MPVAAVATAAAARRTDVPWHRPRSAARARDQFAAIFSDHRTTPAIPGDARARFGAKADPDTAASRPTVPEVATDDEHLPFGAADVANPHGKFGGLTIGEVSTRKRVPTASRGRDGDAHEAALRIGTGHHPGRATPTPDTVPNAQRGHFHLIVHRLRGADRRVASERTPSASGGFINPGREALPVSKRRRRLCRGSGEKCARWFAAHEPWSDRFGRPRRHRADRGDDAGGHL